MRLGAPRGTDQVSVGLIAEQEYGGDILRRVALLYVKGEIADLDAHALREPAANALAAADELGRVSDAEGTI